MDSRSETGEESAFGDGERTGSAAAGSPSLITRPEKASGPAASGRRGNELPEVAGKRRNARCL